MVMNDPLAAALSKINNAEKSPRHENVVVGASKTINAVLEILHKNDYITKFTRVPGARGDTFEVDLTNSINNVGVIKPRFAFKITDWQRFEKQFLPAKGFGIIIVSTSQGMMTLDEAKDKRIGGKLLAYCY